MKLSIKNIGKIKEASVQIDGITVIAGDNNTGKSTVGKALFSVFNSLYQSDLKITTERTNNIKSLIQMLYRNVTDDYFFELDDDELIQSVLSLPSKSASFEKLKTEIFEELVHFDKKFAQVDASSIVNETAERIAANLKVADDDVIFRIVLQRRLDSEFNEQICNQFAVGETSDISLEIRGEQISVCLQDDKVLGISKRINLSTEAIYIDDPFVLDDLAIRFVRGKRYADHRNHLKAKLMESPRDSNVVDEIIATNKLDSIYEKLSAVCAGEIVKNKRFTLSYKANGSSKELDVRNLSTGMKTFAIIKMLLTSGRIEPNGVLILDEPEIHLHPAWQLLFAEMIVLLHCEFGLHILLNTHSPYFLNAIEVYSVKHGISEKCRYYMAHEVHDISYIEDVTNHIDRIYQTLAQPFQELENEGYRDND